MANSGDWERFEAFPESRQLSPDVPAKAEKLAKETYSRRGKRRGYGKWIAAAAAACAALVCIVLPLTLGGGGFETVTDIKAFAEENSLEIRYLENLEEEADDGSLSVTVENRAYRFRDEELAYLYQEAELLRDGEYFYTAKIWIVPGSSGYDEFRQFEKTDVKLEVDGVAVRYRIERSNNRSTVYAKFSEQGNRYYLQFETKLSEASMIEVLKGYFDVTQ